MPTTSTGYANVDAFAWTTNPGESGGKCVPGAPATAAYWPAYAEMLVRNAVFHVDSVFNPLAPFAGVTSAKPAKAHKAKAHKANAHKAKAHKPAKKTAKRHHKKKRRQRK